MSEEELAKKFMKITEQLINWGFDELVSAWSIFRNQTLQRNKSEDAVSAQQFIF